jgi:hypothetical protein
VDCDILSQGQKDVCWLTWMFYLQEFFKTIAGFAYSIPVIGPYLARGLQVAGDKAGANDRAHKDLPV